ncbi:hypothetical protein HHX47_DHR1000991 [Lentinula edodes]|nr:hypothetical protein HHX47_DHR1000991 [Lentinula edodes]
MSGEIFNPNPTVFRSSAKSHSSRSLSTAKKSLWINELEWSQPDQETDEEEEEAIDQDEIFDLIRNIYDPEHPNTLEELHVVSAPQIDIGENRVKPGVVNKQLNDKERVAAALENPALVKTVEDCLTGRV